LLQSIDERLNAALAFWLALFKLREDRDPPPGLGLLRAKESRPYAA
jgi:hypothetical protein